MAEKVGLFERFWGRGDRRRREAEAKELAGELAAAVELYLEAELPDEAARVLLLRADAEQVPERRIAFCAAAARAAVSDELRKSALRRKALLGFDVLGARGAASLRSEILGVARELEEADELERAAEAYAMAGDQESEARALAAAGAIDKLEERLRVSMSEARDQRERSAVLARIADMDRMGERRAALEEAARWLSARQDERVADAVRSIRARLLVGPLCDLEVDGALGRYALGDEITIGRGDATIVVASRAVSRVHARLRRGADGVPLFEDLGTRNGTT
ncbi:MAG TPA: FHA domain-containing protein, partial [Candidatus Nanopelagicales bacterium]|nr:FHA domain-containing protein [Candidatus Nanopelagicales bacterium]